MTPLQYSGKSTPSIRPLRSLLAIRYELSDEFFPQVKRLPGQTDQVAAYINRLLKSTKPTGQLEVAGNLMSDLVRRSSAAKLLLLRAKASATWCTEGPG